MSDSQQQTLNLPSLFFVLILVGLSIRYLFFSSSTNARPPQQGRGADPAHVDQIQQMFPQLNRRDIQWDLQRNGGSVQATTERVLGGRGLERPPPSFQPIEPASSSTAPSRPAPSPPTSSHPDLITRYNLASKLSATSQFEDPMTEEERSSPKSGWSQSKAERQALLQKRREDMVLAARRKMEAREREKEKGKAKEV
ncbi:MAG: hypothetical protein Q9209_004389 [Squamulea sp. 1 TL-2023]